MEMDVEAYLRRRYEGQVADIEIVEKEDLNLVTSHSPFFYHPQLLFCCIMNFPIFPLRYPF